MPRSKYIENWEDKSEEFFNKVQHRAIVHTSMNDGGFFIPRSIDYMPTIKSWVMDGESYDVDGNLLAKNYCQCICNGFKHWKFSGTQAASKTMIDSISSKDPHPDPLGAQPIVVTHGKPEPNKIKTLPTGTNNSIAQNMTDKPKHKCTCDFNSVILVTGCKCGGM